MNSTILKNRPTIKDAVLIFLMVILGTSGALAHTPHDPIDALAVSPNFSQDKTIFAAISDQLFQSVDGGYRWKELVNGLDNTDLISTIAVSPSFGEDETVFIASKSDGLFRSINGGKKWSAVRVERDLVEIDFILFSPHFRDDGILFLLSEEGRVYRSIDRGNSWHAVFNIENRVTVMTVYFENDGLRYLCGDQGGNLYISKDSGENWTTLAEISDSGNLTSIIAVKNEGPGWKYHVGTQKKGVVQVEKGQKDPVSMQNVLGEAHITSLAVSPEYSADRTLFATTWNDAVYISMDAGKTWNQFSKGLTKDHQADSPHYQSPHFRLMGFSNVYQSDSTVFLAGFDGLFKSSNGGREWSELELLPVGIVKGLAVSAERAGVSSIGLTTYGAGAYVSDDQGKTWSVRNKGLTRTRLSDLVFSPEYPTNGLVYSASQGHLLKWDADRNSWTRISLHQKTWRNKLHAISYKLSFLGSLIRKYVRKPPADPWPTKIILSPAFNDDLTLFFSTRWNGVYKSTDGGQENSLQWDAMGQPIKSMVISPDYSTDRTIFLGVRGAGVYRSVDGGVNFQPCNHGMAFIGEWKQTDTKHQTARKDINLAISPNYSLDNTIWCASSEGLYVTKNGGGEWMQIANDVLGGRGYILAIAASRNKTGSPVLMISVKGFGLLKSEDGGKTFVPIAEKMIEANHKIEYIAYSKNFQNDRTIFAASDENLFISRNGGESWKIISRPVRYENHRNVIRYTGEWDTVKKEAYSAMRTHVSDTVNSRASLNFVGGGIKYIGTTSQEHGKAKIYIDDQLVGDVDQYSETEKHIVDLYSIEGLPFGYHRIAVEVTNQKNPESKGFKTSIDAFDVLP